MLTLQVVRLMDKLWLNEGLDLKMVVFSCVPTGKKRGIIEMVTKAETLRKIQVEHGLTGSFKDKPIAEWLAKHNPTELEYERAVENFTGSYMNCLKVVYVAFQTSKSLLFTMRIWKGTCILYVIGYFSKILTLLVF